MVIGPPSVGTTTSAVSREAVTSCASPTTLVAGMRLGSVSERPLASVGVTHGRTPRSQGDGRSEDRLHAWAKASATRVTDWPGPAGAVGPGDVGPGDVGPDDVPLTGAGRTGVVGTPPAAGAVRAGTSPAAAGRAS